MGKISRQRGQVGVLAQDLTELEERVADLEDQVLALQQANMPKPAETPAESKPATPKPAATPATAAKSVRPK